VEIFDETDGSITRPNRTRLTLTMLLMVVVLVVGSVFGISQQRNDQGGRPSDGFEPSESSIVPSDVRTLVDRLSTEYTNLDVEPMLNDGTPQNRAIYWMALEDEWTREGITTYVSIQRIGEPYALVVLYYLDDGDEWNDEVNWILNTTSVCAWNNSTGYNEVKGEFCRDDRSVVAVDLCE